MKHKTATKSPGAGGERAKARSQQRVVRARYSISKARILQISNDISEEMCQCSWAELIEVVRYFRDQFDAVWQARQNERTQLALDLLDMAHPLLNAKPAKLPNTEVSDGGPLAQPETQARTRRSLD